MLVKSEEKTSTEMEIRIIVRITRIMRILVIKRMRIIIVINKQTIQNIKIELN